MGSREVQSTWLLSVRRANDEGGIAYALPWLRAFSRY